MTFIATCCAAEFWAILRRIVQEHVNAVQKQLRGRARGWIKAFVKGVALPRRLQFTELGLDSRFVVLPPSGRQDYIKYECKNASC